MSLQPQTIKQKGENEQVMEQADRLLYFLSQFPLKPLKDEEGMVVSPFDCKRGKRDGVSILEFRAGFSIEDELKITFDDLREGFGEIIEEDELSVDEKGRGVIHISFIGYDIRNTARYIFGQERIIPRARDAYLETVFKDGVDSDVRRETDRKIEMIEANMILILNCYTNPLCVDVEFDFKQKGKDVVLSGGRLYLTLDEDYSSPRKD